MTDSQFVQNFLDHPTILSINAYRYAAVENLKTYDCGQATRLSLRHFPQSPVYEMERFEKADYSIQ